MSYIFMRYYLFSLVEALHLRAFDRCFMFSVSVKRFLKMLPDQISIHDRTKVNPHQTHTHTDRHRHASTRFCGFPMMFDGGGGGSPCSHQQLHAR